MQAQGCVTRMLIGLLALGWLTTAGYAQSSDAKPARPRVDETVPLKDWLESPGQSRDEPGSEASSSSETNWLSRSAYLLFLLALFGTLYFVLKRLKPASGLGRSGLVELVARTQIAPKAHICVVRVGSRMVVIGLTGEQITHLLDLESPQEVVPFLEKPEFKESLEEASRDQAELGLSTAENPVSFRNEIGRLSGVIDSLRRSDPATGEEPA